MDQSKIWPNVDRIFHHAAELNPDARAAFLDKACGQNTDLRREVESLLAFAEKTSGSNDLLLFGSAAGSLAGSALGPYHGLTLIGRGGMGEVYAARDIRLDRKVAI